MRRTPEYWLIISTGFDWPPQPSCFTRPIRSLTRRSPWPRNRQMRLGEKTLSPTGRAFDPQIPRLKGSEWRCEGRSTIRQRRSIAMAAQRASILPHAPHEFPEQRFGGITSLLVFLRRHVGDAAKSIPRLPCSHDARSGDGGRLCRLALNHRRIDGWRCWPGGFRADNPHRQPGASALALASGGRLCGRWSWKVTVRLSCQRQRC